MIKKKSLLLLILCCTAPLVFAQTINSVKLLTAKPLLYEKTVFNINLTATWDNPYLQEDVALDMLLTSPSGKKLKLPCYYESGESGKGSLWKANFAPQETGRYKYTLELSKAGTVVSTSKAQEFKSVASGKNGFLHPKNNWIFQFDNGKPFRGVGENIGWESRKTDDNKFFKALHENNKYNYEYMLPSLASHGGNFYRTWICEFNLPIDWHGPFNNSRYEPSNAYFNPSAIKKIDRMFNLADSLGLYVMLTLGPGNYGTKDGGFSPNDADFFVNPKSKARYKNRLRYFIARWGYSTSVGAWEFFNEVDNMQFSNKKKPVSADSIVNWHDEMSTYLKATDPYKHMITTSISFRDLKGLNSLEHMDFNQRHLYKNTFAIPKTINQYEKNSDKPFVIGEYGYEWDWLKNFDDFSDSMDSDFKRGMWYGLFSPTPILPMSWWWEYFDNRKTDVYINKVRAMSDMMLSAGKGSFKQTVVSAADSSTKVYGVKCGTTTFIYAYNPTATERSVELTFAGELKPGSQPQVYNCEKGEFENTKLIKTSPGNLMAAYTLPANTDVIFIVINP